MGRPKGTKSNFKAAASAKPKTAPKEMYHYNMRDPACVGCKYLGRSTNTCDYILITRRPRQIISPLPDGAEPGQLGQYCRVKKTAKRPKNIGKDGTDFVYVDV